MLPGFHNSSPIISIAETIYKMCARIRGLLEKYPTFGREKETGLLGALDT